MWTSPTYGQVEINEIPLIMKNFFDKNKEFSSHHEIAIGTDSQNVKEGTRIVTVISLISEKRGGIFFYTKNIIPKIKNVKDKLEKETYESLTVANSLIDVLENDDNYNELYLTCPLTIHIDAGNSVNGKTKDLIQGLTGWVHGVGYDYKIKPDSYCSSSIADKLSK